MSCNFKTWCIKNEQTYITRVNVLLSDVYCLKRLFPRAVNDRSKPPPPPSFYTFHCMYVQKNQRPQHNVTFQRVATAGVVSKLSVTSPESPPPINRIHLICSCKGSFREYLYAWWGFSVLRLNTNTPCDRGGSITHNFVHYYIYISIT